MPQYIPFTEEQKSRAADTDLEQFLSQRGERLLPSGHDKRLNSDHSITIRGNRWYDHATGEGGNAISFARRFYGLAFPEAVALLLNGESVCRCKAPEKEQKTAKPFTLPPVNPTMHRVFAYLMKQRGIDREIISAFAHNKLLYEEAAYHNAVFVGTDENSVPRHAHKRSTLSNGSTFRQNVEGSDPKHSFHYTGTNGSLYVFEAPIDLLSYLTLFPQDWRQNSYVACCGVSALPVLERIRQNPNTEQVYLCLDNDRAGHAASERMTELLHRCGIPAERLIPDRKDWNEDLLQRKLYCEVQMDVK